jgi:hypothetical protein
VTSALYEGRLPVLFAAVRTLKTGKVHVARFLIDTGACVTCLPASRAIQWGHSPNDPDAKPFVMPGLGCDWTGNSHPFRFGLLDQKKLWLPPIWESSKSELVFVDNLEGEYGLLGMDVISQWKDFAIRPRESGSGGVVEIVTR